MPEFKSKISKRVSGIMKKIFVRRGRQEERAVPQGLTRRRSLPPRDRSMLTESAVWRHNVERLCREYDSKQPKCRTLNHHLSFMDHQVPPADGTLQNMRLQTRVYTDQLRDLKSEARLLKSQRDGLWREMKEIQEQRIYFERNANRRRSDGGVLHRF